VPLPAPDPTISSTAVIGLPITEELFPRVQARRIPMPQESNELGYFEKRAAEILDYSVDMTPLMDASESIVAAYAWSSNATDLVVTSVRFGYKGVLAFVWGGLDGIEYTLSIIAKTTSGRNIQFKATIAIVDSAAEALAGYRPPVTGTGADPAQSYLTDVLGRFLAPTYIDAIGNPLFSVPA
jgi:hypothetical protein